MFPKNFVNNVLISILYEHMDLLVSQLLTVVGRYTSNTVT